MPFLDPKNIKNINSIALIADKFDEKLALNLNNLNVEWRILRNQNGLDFDLDTLEFQKYVNSLKNGEGDAMYPLINKLVTYIFTTTQQCLCGKAVQFIKFEQNQKQNQNS